MLLGFFKMFGNYAKIMLVSRNYASYTIKSMLPGFEAI